MKTKIIQNGTKKRIQTLYRCPECNQKNSTYRKKTEDYICRSCGCIWMYSEEALEQIEEMNEI